MPTIFPRILTTTALCLSALACNSHIEAAPQLKGNTYYQRTGVSMGDLRRLPFVDGDPEAIKKAYDTITFQAVSSGETLTVTIKNTGKKECYFALYGGAYKIVPNAFLCDARKKGSRSFFTESTRNHSWRGIAFILPCEQRQ